MDSNTTDTAFDKLFVRNMLESFLRIGLVLILIRRGMLLVDRKRRLEL